MYSITTTTTQYSTSTKYVTVLPVTTGASSGSSGSGGSGGSGANVGAVVGAASSGAAGCVPVTVTVTQAPVTVTVVSFPPLNLYDQR